MIVLSAVVVILVDGFGAVYLDTVDDTAPAEGSLADLDVTATADHVSMTHAGGESITIDPLGGLVRGDDGSERSTFDANRVTNDDDDGRFDPGGRFGRDHGLGSGQLEVIRIHIPSNTVLEGPSLDT